MTRNLTVVLGDILGIVPADEVDFRKRLEAVRQSALYAAPEAMVDFWIEGASAFADRFGLDVPTDGWARTVVDIWIGERTKR